MIFQIKAYDEFEYIKKTASNQDQIINNIEFFLLIDYAIVYIGKRKRYPWGLTRNNEKNLFFQKDKI